MVIIVCVCVCVSVCVCVCVFRPARESEAQPDMNFLPLKTTRGVMETSAPPGRQTPRRSPCSPALRRGPADRNSLPSRLFSGPIRQYIKTKGNNFPGSEKAHKPSVYLFSRKPNTCRQEVSVRRVERSIPSCQKGVSFSSVTSLCRNSPLVTVGGTGAREHTGLCCRRALPWDKRRPSTSSYWEFYVRLVLAERYALLARRRWCNYLA